MGKILSAVLIVFVFQSGQAQYCGVSGGLQCSPQSISLNPGFYPNPDSFPVFINNYKGSGIIQFRNFDSIVFGSELLHVNSLHFDTIDNLPPGLCWATDQPGNYYGNAQNGCIHISGTPCGPTGQYKLHVIVSVDIGVIAQSNADPGGLRYFIRLVNPGDPVFTVDSTQTEANPVIQYGGTCIPATPLSLSLGPAQTVCNGSIASLQALVGGGALPYSYLWQTNGSTLSCTNCLNPEVTLNQNSIFTLLVTDANNDTITNSVSYTVTGNPINCVVTSLGATTFCRTGTDTLMAVPDTAVTYQWVRNGNTLGASGNSLAVSDSSGNYTVLFTEPGVCQAQSNIITLTFFDSPPAVISTLGSANICQGSMVILQADTSISGLSYQWQVNGINDSVIAPVLFATLPGNYDVIVKNANNCSDTSNVVAVSQNSNNPPQVTLTGYPETLCYNALPITLSGNSPQGGNFSGGAVWGNIFYSDSGHVGSNVLTYTYTDSNGCSGWASDSIILIFCTGVEDLNPEDGITLYPNPAIDMLTAESVLFNQGDFRFAIYDLTGRLIEIPHVIDTAKIVFSTAQLSEGVYVIQFKVNGQTVIKKFVKAE